MLGRIYAYLVLEVGLRDLDSLDKSFHISYLYIENFCLQLLQKIYIYHLLLLVWRRGALT